MKANGTRVLIISIILYFIFVLLSFSSFAQPEYDFSSGTLMSGTDKTVGATYRFTNVKPGVDAIVTLTNLTGGITLANIDGASGFKEAFQPVIDVPALTMGYAEFNIEFVDAGTTTPRVMLEVPITCIDVDGKVNPGGPIYEFDQVQFPSGSYVDYTLIGLELKVDFLTAGFATGTNIAANDYPGVDTMARQAMFSVLTANISSTVIRVGADNRLGTAGQQRLRSVYFKRFTYPMSFLAQPSLQSFRGLEKDKYVELQWTLRSETRPVKVVIERANTAGQFSSIGESMPAETSSLGMYSFRDNNPIAANTFYRLKMEQANGTVQYSNILLFRAAEGSQQSFKIYPTAFHSTATMNVKALNRAAGQLQLVDYAGRIVQQQSINIQEGSNTIQLENLSNINSGAYIAVLKLDNQTYQQKIIKQ